MNIRPERKSAVAVDAAALGRVGTALADPTRRRLLLALVAGPGFPSDLAVQLSLSRANVSNHLSCLRGCGLVTPHPVGRRVQYELADPRLATALAELASLVLITASPDGAADTACAPDDYTCIGGPDSDNIAPDNIAPDNIAPDNIAPDNIALDNIAPDNIALDDIALDDVASAVVAEAGRHGDGNEGRS